MPISKDFISIQTCNGKNPLNPTCIKVTDFEFIKFSKIQQIEFRDYTYDFPNRSGALISFNNKEDMTNFALEISKYVLSNLDLTAHQKYQFIQQIIQKKK